MPSGTNLELETAPVSRWEIKPSPALIVGTLALGIASFLILSRDYASFGVETDLLGGFKLAAEKLQQGQALDVKYHLPFYPALLAAIEPLVGGWFEAGLIITWFSTLVVLATSYRLACDLLNWQTGLGVITACATSGLFLAHSGVASSDMLFLALYQSTCLIGFLAFRDRRQVYWLFTGLLIAICYLTRTNGIVLLLFFAVPFLLRDNLSTKALASLTMATGILIGFAPWATYALVTGSPLVPTHSHLTLATTFYDKSFGLHSGDFIRFAGQQFGNIWEVLAYDPARIPVAYAENFVELIVVCLPKLVSIPALMLLMPGLFIVIFRPVCRFVPFLTVLTVAHVLLSLFADFNPRYFLFLLPFLALGLAKTLEITAEHLDQINLRRFFYCIVVLSFLASFTISIESAWRTSRTGEKELAAVIPIVNSIAADEDLILFARKPNLRYHAQVDSKSMPIVNTLEELKEKLLAHSGANPLYLYFGSMEARYRPELAYLRYADFQVAWLTPVASGAEGGGWALYAVQDLASD